MRRRPVVLALIALPLAVAASAVAHAEGQDGGEKKEKKPTDRLPPAPVKGERYARLPTIPLELWDKNGQYHMTTIDLILQVPEQAKFSEKKLSETLRKALNIIPYEEYARANPAPMIKALVLDLVRAEPGLEMTRDVLIAKMLFR